MNDCLEIYTDGSYKAGRGSWAFVIVRNGVVLYEGCGRGLKSASDKISSHRMEFQAAIEAMKVLPTGSRAILFSDFKVLIQTMNCWVTEWFENGWVKSNDRPVPNVDQVKNLHALNERHQIIWKWVKAHSGVPYNERCDQLCLIKRG